MAYATVADLESYLPAGLPRPGGADLARLLDRAAALIDQAVIVAYDPAAEHVVAALRDASCAQVEYWLLSPTGPDQARTAGPIRSVRIGTLAVEYISASASPSAAMSRSGRLAPDAEAALTRAGLLDAAAPTMPQWPHLTPREWWRP